MKRDVGDNCAGNIESQEQSGF